MPPARKTLILHAGMGKTGTTAIQHTFWNNRAALARAGIAYPAIGAASGAHHLISPHIMADPTAQMPWRRHLAPGEWAPKVAALPEPRVFMSSELISSAEPDQIAAFCAALAPFFDLRLCLYLRRQDDMIAAGYAQGVKAGTQRPPLEKILENQSNRFNYMETIAPWEAALGRDHLIILPYERGQFHAGDLIRDVLFRTLGLPDLPPGFVHDPAANPNARLSAPATEFKRLVNLLIPDRTRSRAYVAPLSACPPDPKGTHLLGRADRAEVIARFAASNARVAQTYMNRPAGDLFRESLSPDAPETAPRIGPAELRAVATILGQKAPGLFHDLLGLVARKDSGTPAVRKAATSLAIALEGLPPPRRPLSQRLGLGRLLGPLRRIDDTFAGAAPDAEPEPSTRATAKVPSPAVVTRPQPAKRAAAEAHGPQMLVHFGTRKTGSSSIQETLFRNAGALGTTRYLSYGMANSSLMVRDLFVAPDRLPAEGLDMVRARFAAGLHDITPAPRAIFSAETISDLDAAGLERLIGALSANGAQLSFIGYLREPVSYLRSLFQEQIKYAHDKPFGYAPDANFRSNYHRIVDRIDRIAGPDRVHVFPFERDLFPQGDVVRHFLAEAGIDPEGLSIHHVNESLSMTAVKALYSYRRLRVARDADINSNTTRETFIARLATLGGPAFRFSPEIDAAIAAANTHILDWSEARLGRRLALPVRKDDDGIRGEADMTRFSEEDLARLQALARAEGLAGLPAGVTPDTAAEAVADLLHALRLKVAQDESREEPDPMPAPIARPIPLTRAATPVPVRRTEPGSLRLFVHFGIHKTGSSSIQQTLLSNADALRPFRYLSFGRANSSGLINRAFGRDETGRSIRALSRTALAAALKVTPRSDIGLLSAEAICHLRPDELTDFHGFLADQGADPVFMGYLRDPVSYTRSAFQQVIKTKPPPAWPFSARKADMRWNYHRIVDQLDELAGPDRVHVFPFERDLFPQGDVVRHFLDQAGIDPEGLTIQRVNESLSMTAVKALYSYRSLRMARDADINSKTTREAFIARLATLGGPAFRFSPEIDAAIAAANTHILDWSEARLGRRLALPVRKDDDGIRGEADMTRFSEEDLARLQALARAEGLAGLPAGVTPDTAAEAVADLLHALRLKVAQEESGLLETLRRKLTRKTTHAPRANSPSR